MLLLEHKGLQENLTRRLLTDLDAAQTWMLLLGRKSADERVASFALLCAEKLHGTDNNALCDGNECRVELPLSRTEIAEFLGLTIEIVSRMLRRLDS